MSKKDSTLPSEDEKVATTTREEKEGKTIKRGGFLYVIMFVHGLSLLFSWSALILSYYYFTHRLESLKHSDYVLDYLLLIFFSVRLVFLFVTPYILRVINHFYMIRISQTGIFLCFLLFGIMALVGENWSTGAFMSLVILIVLLSAIFSVAAYLSGLAIVALIPPHYTQAMSAGQGSASLISSVMKMIAVFASNRSSSVGSDSVIYFWMTSFCSLLSLLLFWPVRSIVRQWDTITQVPEASLRSEDNCEVGTLLKVSSSPSPSIQLQSRPQSPVAIYSIKETFSRYYRTYTHIRGYFWFLFTTMFQYIFIVPAFVNMTRSTQVENYGPADSLYSIKVFPVFILLIIGISDFTGRMILRSKKCQIRHPLFHPLLILFRFVAMPFIMLGNMCLERGMIYPFPRPFANDIIFAILLSLYTFSGGYSITHLLMFAPKKAPEDFRKDASFVLVFCQGIGMFVGVLCALLYKMLLYGLAKTG